MRVVEASLSAIARSSAALGHSTMTAALLRTLERPAVDVGQLQHVVACPPRRSGFWSDLGILVDLDRDLAPGARPPRQDRVSPACAGAGKALDHHGSRRWCTRCGNASPARAAAAGLAGDQG